MSALRSERTLAANAENLVGEILTKKRTLLESTSRDSFEFPTLLKSPGTGKDVLSLKSYGDLARS